MSAIEWPIICMCTIFHPFCICFSGWRLNFIGIIVRSLCTFLDAINVTACSLYNSFHVIELVLIDLSPSLEVTIKCFSKSRSNNIFLFSLELIIVSQGSINLLLKATHALSECWTVTLCIYSAFLEFFTYSMWMSTIKHIHLSLEDALLKFVSITLSIDSGESVPFSKGIYVWLNLFAIIDVSLSSCSSNNMIKINPVLLHCLLSSLHIWALKGPGLVENVEHCFVIISNWR